MKVNSSAKNDEVMFTGQTQLKMSDFNVKPLEFLMGVFTTGDEVTVTFEVLFKQEFTKD